MSDHNNSPRGVAEPATDIGDNYVLPGSRSGEPLSNRKVRGSDLRARREEIVLMPDSGPVTTAGVIAVVNLEARIDGQAARATEGRLTVGERTELVELIALRGHVLGHVADAERAAAMADELAAQLPNDARP